MLQYDTNNVFESLQDVNSFLTLLMVGTPDDKSLLENYRQTKRVTSGITEIILCVLPFLRQYPKLFGNDIG